MDFFKLLGNRYIQKLQTKSWFIVIWTTNGHFENHNKTNTFGELDFLKISVWYLGHHKYEEEKKNNVKIIL